MKAPYLLDILILGLLEFSFTIHASIYFSGKIFIFCKPSLINGNNLVRSYVNIKLLILGFGSLLTSSVLVGVINNFGGLLIKRLNKGVLNTSPCLNPVSDTTASEFCF